MTTTTAASTEAQSTATRTERPPADERGLSNMPPTTKVIAGDVEKAIKNDLAIMAETAPEVAASGLAATVVALAKSIDSPATSPTARSMLARALMDTMTRLLALVPDPQENATDALDDLAARRAAHRS